MQKIIFIGGASASGKTTLAKKLGTHLGLPWFSIDYVHDMALMISDRENFQEAHRVRDYSADSFYHEHSINEVVESEIKISHEVWPAVKALVDSGYEGVIEGVAALPELVHSLGNIEGLQVLYLDNDNEEDILKIAQERGIWDLPHLYSRDVRKQEVDFVLAYNEMLRKEVIKYNYPMIHITRSDEDLEKALEVLQ